VKFWCIGSHHGLGGSTGRVIFPALPVVVPLSALSHPVSVTLLALAAVPAFARVLVLEAVSALALGLGQMLQLRNQLPAG